MSEGATTCVADREATAWAATHWEATDWDWVDAAPFRAHVRHLVDTTGVSWQVLALYAQVPCPLMRSLVLGRGERRVRRIAPAYAKALLDITPARLRLSRCRRVSATHTTGLCRGLVAAGVDVDQVATMLGLTCPQTRRLLGGQLTTVCLLTEFAARAACMAHGLCDPATEVFAGGTLGVDDPLAA